MSSWRNHDRAFKAEVRRLRSDATAERIDLVRSLDLSALRSVVERVQGGDHKAALAWLRIRRIGELDLLTTQAESHEAGKGAFGPVEAEVKRIMEDADYLRSIKMPADTLGERMFDESPADARGLSDA